MEGRETFDTVVWHDKYMEFSVVHINWGFTMGRLSGVFKRGTGLMPTTDMAPALAVCLLQSIAERHAILPKLTVVLNSTTTDQLLDVFLQRLADSAQADLPPSSDQESLELPDVL